MSIDKTPGYFYNPNSIYHGHKILLPTSDRDRLKLLQMEFDRLCDFVEFLFEHSEHCDHITQREAWKEFEIYEAKNSYHAQQIREYRKKRKEQTP